jgi:hypothetical protein
MTETQPIRESYENLRDGVENSAVRDAWKEGDR